MNQCVGFASGAGIEPALSRVTRWLENPSTSRVWLFYDRSGSAENGAIAEALEQLLLLKDRNLSRLSLGIAMEREPDEAALLSGRLDAEKIRALSGRLFKPDAVEEYFVCGPEGFASEVRAALSDTGVRADRVHVERAEGAESSHAAVGPAATGKPAAAATVPTTATPAVVSKPTLAAKEGETQVTFVMDGRRRSFTMRTDHESILDAADRAGIELPFSCKAGVCATCRTKLVKGKVDLLENSALEDWELEQGFILACQARARTPEIELTYDEK